MTSEGYTYVYNLWPSDDQWDTLTIALTKMVSEGFAYEYNL